MISPRRSLDIGVLHAELDVRDAEISMLRARLSVCESCPPPSPTTTPIFMSCTPSKPGKSQAMAMAADDSTRRPLYGAIRPATTEEDNGRCASAERHSATMALRLARLREWLRRARRMTAHALQSLVGRAPSRTASRAASVTQPSGDTAAGRGERQWRLGVRVVPVVDRADHNLRHAPFCSGFCQGHCAGLSAYGSHHGARRRSDATHRAVPSLREPPGRCVLGASTVLTYAEMVSRKRELLNSACGGHLERHLAPCDMLERFGMPRAALEDMDAGELAERRYAAGLTPSQLAVVSPVGHR